MSLVTLNLHYIELYVEKKIQWDKTQQLMKKDSAIFDHVDHGDQVTYASNGGGTYG